MPELPEVETIRLGLEKHLVGHKITDVEIKLRKIVQGDEKNIIGGKVTGVRRFGKGLVIDLDNGYLLAIHIKLTGQLIYRKVSKGGKVSEVPKEEEKIKVIRGTYEVLPNKWTHVIFHLDKDASLYYNDFRQFGWIKIVKQEELQKLVFFKELGPEFFKDLTSEKFRDIVKKSKTVIKPLLMDQKKISGVGNIYANDGLFDAKIDPKRKANILSDKEIENLFTSVEKVLKLGLKLGGASELSFVNALGGEGKYQEHFLVYGQEGKPCPRDGSIIQKIALGGRGTYFCPTCQK